MTVRTVGFWWLWLWFKRTTNLIVLSSSEGHLSGRWCGTQGIRFFPAVGLGREGDVGAAVGAGNS